MDEKTGNEVMDGTVQTGAIRLVLADSQGIYRVGIARVLSLEADIHLAAEAESLEELRIVIERFPTDIVLVESELLKAPNSILELQRVSPDIKLIVQTTSISEDQTVEFYRRGIRGIIPRSISPDLLVRCVRCINSGETWIDNEALNWVISAYRVQDSSIRSPRSQVRLSPKEMAIITCITKGLRNKEIAFQLETTEQVIKNYLRKIYDKLGVSDRLELALYCLQKKLVKGDVDEIAISQTARQIA
jgi:DNA-binding NarL/FixJ family response regulator